MTEKRFTYFKSKIGFGKQGIDDNLKGYTFDFTLDNVLDCMNELHEENRELQRHLDVMRSGALTDDKRIKELYDENEQLKQENKGIQDKVWKLLELLEKEKGIDKRKIIDWWNGDVG